MAQQVGGAPAAPRHSAKASASRCCCMHCTHCRRRAVRSASSRTAPKHAHSVCWRRWAAACSTMLLCHRLVAAKACAKAAVLIAKENSEIFLPQLTSLSYASNIILSEANQLISSSQSNFLEGGWKYVSRGVQPATDAHLPCVHGVRQREAVPAAHNDGDHGACLRAGARGQ